MPVAVISIYHGGGGSLVQDMDSLDTEGLDAQLLVDKLIEYGVLTDGTEVLSFDIEGKDENAVGTLDLNQAESAEAVPTRCSSLRLAIHSLKTLSCPSLS